MNSLSDNPKPFFSHLEVDVLLATYNGAKYIQGQLDSLSNQKHVVINLFVSDDGSSDNTIEIIESSRHQFKSLVFLRESPNLGPAENFIYLMTNFKGEAKYIALMDQDDIWHPNHLISSLEEIGKFGDRPAMTFSTCREFGRKRRRPKLWPEESFNLNSHLIYFENPCRGCTIVLNRWAIDLVRLYNPTKIIMHDWWLLILINELGSVSHIKEPNVDYRLHLSNHTGRRSSLNRIIQIFSLLRFKNWRTVVQLVSISCTIIASGQKTSSEMEDLVRLLECRNLKNRFKILTSKKKLRTSRLEDIVLRILLSVIP